MSDKTLKPCPDQCAEGKPELIETHYMEGPVKVRCKQVRCSCCGIAAPMAETIADAVEAWDCLQLNTRPEPEAREPVAWALSDPDTGQLWYINESKESIDRQLQYTPKDRVVPLYATPPDDEARRLLDEAQLAANEAGFAFMSPAEVIRHLAQTDGKGE